MANETRLIARLVVAAGVALGVLNTAVLGQDNKEEKPALGGPKVDAHRPPGTENALGGGERRRMAERVPPRVYRDALMSLAAPDAPEEIRATKEQEEKIRSIWADFEKREQQYMNEHKEELQKARRAAAARDGKPSDAQKPDEAVGKGSGAEDARAIYRKAMEGAPKIEEAYARIWKELTEPQQKAVEAKFAEFRAQESERRMDEYVQKRLGEKGIDANAKRPAAREQKDEMEMPATRKPARGEGLTPDRRERLLRLFESMTPEQQDMLLDRIEQRVKDLRAERGNDAPGKDRSRATKKPAPNVEKVKVPKPEETENK